MSKILGKLHGKVIGGKIPSINPGVSYILKQCEGMDIELTITPYVRKRSNAQNAYYWPVIVEYVLEGLIDAGYRRDQLEPELVHQFLKGKFLKHMKRRIVKPGGGNYLTRQPSTSELTTWEFMDYLEGIVIWAAEFLNIEIPEPNKEWKQKAEEEYAQALKLGLIDPNERNRVRIALKLAA